MVLADTSNGDIGWKKWLVAGWAFMECLLFGGLLYGWGSIVFILKTEGIYADLCPELDSLSNATITPNTSVVIVPANVTIIDKAHNYTVPDVSSTNNGSAVTTDVTSTKTGPKGSGCDPQDSNMALCFTIASALFCVGCAALGQVSYSFGTRVTRIISFVSFIIGAIMMAFISKENPWLMFPGLSLLGIGGLPILVTNAQVSNLFLVGSSSVVGLLCGGFDMSSAVMLMVKLAHENGFSRQYMFLLIAVLHLLLLVSTFFFLPKDFIAKPKVKVVQTSEVAEENEQGVELIRSKAPQDAAESDKELPSLVSCIKKPAFIFHIFWLCLLQLRFYYFLGTLNTYLTRLLDGDEGLVSYFTNVCFYTMMGGLVSSFLSGFIYDYVKTFFKDGKSQAYREVLPAALPLAIASFLSVLLSVLVLIPSVQLLYVIFIVMTIHRSFLYSMGAAFISAIFPSEYFGILYGIMIVVGGVVGFNQFALFKWSEAYPEGGQHANIFLLVIGVLSFVHPLYLWFSCWREERKFKVN